VLVLYDDGTLCVASVLQGILNMKDIDVSQSLELADLESALKELEERAQEDIDVMYGVHRARKTDLRRFQRLMEHLARSRLRIAVFRGQSAGVHTQRRIDLISARYEVLEALYEGAVTRISDHRAWKLSHRLDWLIIAIIVIDIILVVWRA
jgi:hypothetical protein